MPSSTRSYTATSWERLAPRLSKAPAADEVLHSPLVHVRAVEHPLAEILEGGKGPVLLPLAHHGLDKTPADVLHGHQAEADAALLHGEPVIGAVHIRRQQGDAAVLALGDVFGHLVGVVQHRGQQGSHILPGKVALEVRRLIRHHRIADSVGLVEGIVGEVVNLVEDILGRGLRNAAGNAAPDAPGGVAVEKGLPLPLHVLGLLFGHGPAHHVRLAQGIARQLLEDLDDLLLVHDAAVGAGEDRLQLGVLIGHQGGVVLAGHKPGEESRAPGGTGR